MIKNMLSTACIGLAAAGCLVCLSGCGKEKVHSGSEYETDEVSAVYMEADTWDIHMNVSSDDKIQVSFKGDVSKGEPQPEVQLQGGVLQVVQERGKETLGDKIALGKKGEITVCLPEKYRLPIEIHNGSGDIQMDRVEAVDFQLESDSGYAVLSEVTAEQAQVTSHSGDITWEGGDIADISMNMAAGYGVIKKTVFQRVEAEAESGEINISGAQADTDIRIQTESGDISLGYEIEPENLEFDIAAKSKDLSVGLAGASYSKETEGTRQGVIGEGKYGLEIVSDSGTVVVK